MIRHAIPCHSANHSSPREFATCTHTHAQGYTQKKLVMHDQTDRKERGQTDTWSGLTEDIKKIKGHGPVGFSQEEAKLAEEYSSPVEEEQ